MNVEPSIFYERKFNEIKLAKLTNHIKTVLNQ